MNSSAAFALSDVELLIKQRGIVGTPLEITCMGHPILKQKAKLIDSPQADFTLQHIANMFATIDKLGRDNVAGLAAPQVNIPYRILIFQVPSRRSKDHTQIPYTLLINPNYEPLDVEMEEGFEACFSLPGLVGLVPRYTKIRSTFRNDGGNDRHFSLH